MSHQDQGDNYLPYIFLNLVISLQVKSYCMIFRYIVLTGFLFLFIGGALSQDPVNMNSDLSRIKIGELSDEQILHIRQRA